MTRLVPGPQISGVVYSKQTGAPLSGVTVTPSQALYTTPEFTTPVSTLLTDGEGGFAAYAQPGVYTFTLSDASGVIPEPVEVRSPDQGTSIPLLKSIADAAYAALGTTVITLAASSGTDDSTMIQTALTAARVAGGAYIVGKPGQNYQWGATYPIIGSNTFLDLSQCTVTSNPGSNTSILRNFATIPVSTASDAAITSGSNVVTTSLGASAVVGQSVEITAAGPGPGTTPLNGIVSAQTSTTITLVKLDGTNANALATVSAANIFLYNRDTNITIKIGKVNRGNNGGSGFGVHSLGLLHIDGLTVELGAFLATNAKYGIYAGDITRFKFSVRGANCSSNALQVMGPALGGEVTYMDGKMGDDFLALGASDASQPYTAGDIADVYVGTLNCGGTPTNIFKLYGLTGSKIKNVRVNEAFGFNTGGLSIGAADQAGATVDDISIGTFNGDGTGITLAASGGTVRIDAVSTSYALNNPITVVNVSAGTSLSCVDIGSMDVPNAASLGGGSALVSIAGTVTDLYLGRAKWAPPAGANPCINLAGSGAALTRAFLSKITNLGGGGFVKAGTAGQTLGEVWISDSYQTGAGFVLDTAVTTIVHISNVQSDSPANGTFNVRATGNLTILGHGASKLGGNVSTTAGYALRINCPDFQTNATLVTAKSVGDQLFNTATGQTYSTGSIIWDGTTYRPLIGYVATSNATLVAGTVTIANASITAAARIRVTTVTPGGTVGAPFISAVTAGTGFVISSTSSTDTSVVRYEIESF